MPGFSSEENIILNSVSDGITVNSQNVFLYVNETFAKMVGYSVSELLEMNTLEVTAPDYVELIKERTFNRQKGLEVVPIYEVELLRKDGTRFPAEFSVSRIDFDGKSSSLTIVRDISQQKQVEKDLRQSEDLFRGFMQSALEGIAIFDKTLHYIEVNESWLDISGLDREEVIGKHLLEVFPSMEENGRYDTYMKVLESGTPVVLNGVKSASKRGLILDVSVFTTGDILGVISRDVTDQVRYQRQLEYLHDHAASLSSAESIEEVAEITRDTLTGVLGFTLGSFGIVEKDYLNHKFRWGTIDREGFKMPINGPGITVEVANSGKTFRTGNIEDTKYYVDMAGDPSIRSELAVPVIVSGKVEAIINIEDRENDAFSEEDQRLVETLASHIASAFTKIKYNEKLSALHSFVLELSYLESKEEVVQTTFRIMREVLGFQFSSFQLLENESLVTVGTNDSSDLGTVFPISGRGITTKAVREERTIRLGDVRDDPDFIRVSTDSRSELAVPIFSDNRILGVLNVESLQLNAYSDNDARLLEILAQNVGASLSRVSAIEEKMKLESDLKDSDLRLRSFLDSMEIGFAIWDKDFNYVDINQTVLDRTGFTREEMIGKNIREINPRFDESGRREDYNRVMETGEPFRTEDAIFKTNEGYRRFSLRSYKVGDGIGNITRDITEDYRLLQELRESEERYRAFSESASESFVLFDSELNFVAINTVGAERLGLTREEVLGRPMLEVMPDLIGSERYEWYIEVLRTGVPQVFDVVNHFSGIRLLRMNAFKVGDGLGILATDLSELVKEQEEHERLFEELTDERVRRENEEELSQLKTQFMNTATHEIRTPITSIKGYTELISETLDRGDVFTAQKYIEVVTRNVDRLEILSNDLLDLQRLESGRIEIKKQTCIIGDLLGDLESEIKPIVDRTGHVLTIKMDESLEFMCDKPRISQVLINLVGNASKYSPAGSEVLIEVYQTKDSVVISVTDHGVGLSEEDLSKLFTPFPDIHVNEYSRGSGLGLSVSKGIVELHGGKIWATSEGKGSTFTFTLPIILHGN